MKPRQKSKSVVIALSLVAFCSISPSLLISTAAFAEASTRPAVLTASAVAVARDGSLLVTDDGGGAIWRIAYKGP